jgi:hypothetical protein
VAVEGAGHWLRIVPRARCVHNAEYRFGVEDRLDAGAQFGLEGEDDDDAEVAEVAEVAEDSGMRCSTLVVAVEADKDRLAVDNAGRKGVNMKVKAEAAVAVGFATAHAPWTNHWGAEAALRELRDWRLARMALREKAVSSMGLFWSWAWLRVVQCYERDMGGVVCGRKKMERDDTTLAAPVEPLSEQSDTDHRMVRYDTVQCEIVQNSA